MTWTGALIYSGTPFLVPNSLPGAAQWYNVTFAATQFDYGYSDLGAFLRSGSGVQPNGFTSDGFGFSIVTGAKEQIVRLKANAVWHDLGPVGSVQMVITKNQEVVSSPDHPLVGYPEISPSNQRRIYGTTTDFSTTTHPCYLAPNATHVFRCAAWNCFDAGYSGAAAYIDSAAFSVEILRRET